MSTLLPPLSRTFGPFWDRDYRILWQATVLSTTSYFLQATLLTWLVLELTDSPWQVALVGFFGWAPLLFLGLVGGALADSLDRRRLLMATLSVNLAAAIVMTVLLANGWEQVWHAYLIMLVSGSADALGMPSRRALIHDIVGRTGVTKGVALDTMGMNASGMIGPASAGALITVTGVTGGYAAVVTSYLAAVTLLMMLGTRSRSDRKSVDVPVAGALRLGLKYVSGHQALLAIVLVTVIMNLAVTPYRQMIPVVTRDVLGVSPGLMGILMSAHGLGALVGALLVASGPSIRYHGRVFLSASLLALVAVLLFSLSRSYVLSLLIVVMAGLGNAGFNTMQMSMAMLLPRDEMRGTALGAVSLGVGAGPVGMLITGGVASAYGTTNAIGLNATLGLACLLLIGLFVPALRRRIIN